MLQKNKMFVDRKLFVGFKLCFSRFSRL